MVTCYIHRTNVCRPQWQVDSLLEDREQRSVDGQMDWGLYQLITTDDLSVP